MGTYYILGVGFNIASVMQGLKWGEPELKR